MPKPRLIIPHNPDGSLPDLAIYHATSRVVHRQFLFQAEEKEQFRILMRMYERFSGCRVLSYCVMTNHFHLLLEVPPPPTNGEFGLTEEELIHRLGGLYSRAYVAGVRAEILEARLIAEGKPEHFSRLSKADQKKEIAKAVQCKVRYFRDGAVLGSKKFVNDFFESQRERFSPKRKDGARRTRGSLKDLAGEIWTLRDLKDG